MDEQEKNEIDPAMNLAIMLATGNLSEEGINHLKEHVTWRDDDGWLYILAILPEEYKSKGSLAYRLLNEREVAGDWAELLFSGETADLIALAKEKIKQSYDQRSWKYVFESRLGSQHFKVKNSPELAWLVKQMALLVAPSSFMNSYRVEEKLQQLFAECSTDGLDELVDRYDDFENLFYLQFLVGQSSKYRDKIIPLIDDVEKARRIIAWSDNSELVEGALQFLFRSGKEIGLWFSSVIEHKKKFIELDERLREYAKAHSVASWECIALANNDFNFARQALTMVNNVGEAFSLFYALKKHWDSPDLTEEQRQECWNFLDELCEKQFAFEKRFCCEFLTFFRYIDESPVLTKKYLTRLADQYFSKPFDVDDLLSEFKGFPVKSLRVRYWNEMTAKASTVEDFCALANYQGSVPVRVNCSKKKCLAKAKSLAKTRSDYAHLYEQVPPADRASIFKKLCELPAE